MFILYILRGKKNHLYVGITTNLYKGLLKHKTGDGTEFAKRNQTFDVVYTETFTSLLTARRRETQIKGWRREKKENLIKYGKPVI
ncbi:MAG: GIY-YIG nuclease family protein [Candidatus Levybacteria bacterium]|nr:GIY-YIG nuclease family protein [Candidatus Levybacteria bacterium]